MKYLHHTTDVDEIRQELLQYGHVARNIVNAYHRTTKELLKMFFIDLEPGTNNKEVLCSVFRASWINLSEIANKMSHHSTLFPAILYMFPLYQKTETQRKTIQPTFEMC
jgi:hypothetical protein